MSKTHYIVQHGTSVVELAGHGLTKEKAEEAAALLEVKGKQHVRIRIEDPIHKTWPLNLDGDLEETK